MSDAVMVSLLAATVTGLLVGCSRSSATPVNGPDGQPGWFSVSCKGEKKNCDEKSGEVCPYGYELVDMSENAGTTFASYKSAYVTPSYRGYMVIKCYGAAAAVADGGDDGG
jgi:hypothetical protein